MADRKQIAIVGAGISGLLACKYALSKNLDPIVFESRAGLGGLWTKTLSTTRLQTQKPIFQFSDFPWPESVTDDFPSHREVLEYLESYAEHFDLTRHIQFNTKVVGIQYQGVPKEKEEMKAWSAWGGKWEVEVEKTHRGTASKTEVFEADFVILCVGKYSDIPNIPDFAPGKGPEAFPGKVIHSMEYSELGPHEVRNMVKGKRVAVVGMRKHALDIAMECSAINGAENPCRVVFRREHWNVPDYMTWGFPLVKSCLNRFSELLVHKPGEGLLLSFLATILAPLKGAISKRVESDIKHKHRLVKRGMVPKQSFLQEVSSCVISVVPEKFYDRVDEGSIVLTKAPSFGFCDQGIVVVDGNGEDQTPLETDLVILATGFKGEKKLQDIFVSKRFREIIAGSLDADVPLYRDCIPPRIPQLAVVGFSDSISNLFTAEMSCRWLAELLDGKFKLPEIKAMEEEASRWDEYLKEYSGDNYKRSCIGAINIWHNDQLCKDMGWNPRRKSGLWAELFEPYGPLDYVSP